VHRKTEATSYKLQHYAVIEERTGERFEGTRWVRLELAE
jgi:hypothetical protein